MQIGSGVLKTCTIERSFLAHVVGSVEAVYNLVNGSDTAPVGNLHQSYATIASMPGLMFGIINIVGQSLSLLLALPHLCLSPVFCCYQPHISGMCQLAGHSGKILHSVLSCRLI